MAVTEVDVEIAMQRNQGDFRIWMRRSRAEVRALLEKNQGTLLSEQMRMGSRSKTYRQHAPSWDIAIILAAVWLRDFCAFEDSVAYDPADERVVVDLSRVQDPQETRTRWERRVLAIELSGIDEHGRLFAEDGDYDLDVRALVEFVRGLGTEEARQALLRAYGQQKGGHTA